MTSKNAPRGRRPDLPGSAVLCVIAVFSPSLSAEPPGADAFAGTRTNFGESFETACLGSVETLSATLGADGITARKEDGAAAAPEEQPKKPSLVDLGFPPDQASGSAEAQARLDKRSHMLKIHQRLGLITLIPMVATIFAGGSAGSHGSRSSRDLHGALGLVTAGMYITTASYAIRAPSVPGMQVRGPIRVHKALAWVHGAGMILTPILGAMARSQLDRGEKVHGIATAHSAVADVTVAAYAAAIGSVALKF